MADNFFQGLAQLGQALSDPNAYWQAQRQKDEVKKAEAPETKWATSRWHRSWRNLPR